MSRARIVVAALSLSAAGLIGIVSHEGYTDTAVVPVPGDVPTVGFGSTRRADGAPVQMGDRTTPVRALVRAADAVSQTEQRLRACIGDVPLHQHEWDAVVSWAYNVGPGAACASTLVRRLRARDYAGACDELRRWVHAGGRRVHGLAVRRERERAQCLGQSDSREQ